MVLWNFFFFFENVPSLWCPRDLFWEAARRYRGGNSLHLNEARAWCERERAAALTGNVGGSSRKPSQHVTFASRIGPYTD